MMRNKIKDYLPSKLSAIDKLKINRFVGFLFNRSNLITAGIVRLFARRQNTYSAL